jgi:hypothetical protein
MKKIQVKIGTRKHTQHVFVEDLAKLYYIKARTTPRLPNFNDGLSHYQEDSHDILIGVRSE